MRFAVVLWATYTLLVAVVAGMTLTWGTPREPIEVASSTPAPGAPPGPPQMATSTCTFRGDTEIACTQTWDQGRAPTTLVLPWPLSPDSAAEVTRLRAEWPPLPEPGREHYLTPHERQPFFGHLPSTPVRHCPEGPREPWVRGCLDGTLGYVAWDRDDRLLRWDDWDGPELRLNPDPAVWPNPMPSPHACPDGAAWVPYNGPVCP